MGCNSSSSAHLQVDVPKDDALGSPKQSRDELMAAGEALAREHGMAFPSASDAPSVARQDDALDGSIDASKDTRVEPRTKRRKSFSQMVATAKADSALTFKKRPRRASKTELGDTVLNIAFVLRAALSDAPALPASASLSALHRLFDERAHPLDEASPSCREMPPLAFICAVLARMQIVGDVEDAVMLVALMHLERAQAQGDIDLLPTNWRLLYLMALIASSKVLALSAHALCARPPMVARGADASARAAARSCCTMWPSATTISRPPSPS